MTRPLSSLLLCAALFLAGRSLFAQEEPPTLQSRAAQAAALARTGQLKEAEARYREIVMDGMRTLGAEDPAVLDLRIAQIRVWCVMGRYEEAEEKARNILRVLVRDLGPDQGATMLIWRTLGECQAGQGHFESADRVYATVIDVLTRAHKEEHADMVRAHIGQAKVELAKKDYVNAAADLRAQLPSAERLLGPNHPETLALYADLATCAKQSGSVSEAITLLTHAYQVALKKLGPDHMDTKKYEARLKELEDSVSKKPEAKGQKPD
jgi:tetratricopeptide (TPR) repeat protein